MTNLWCSADLAIFGDNLWLQNSIPFVVCMFYVKELSYSIIFEPDTVCIDDTQQPASSSERGTLPYNFQVHIWTMNATCILYQSPHFSSLTSDQNSKLELLVYCLLNKSSIFWDPWVHVWIFIQIWDFNSYVTI